MIYRVKLRNKETNTSDWTNIIAYTKKDAKRKIIVAMIYSNVYDIFEIRKIKKVI